METTRLPPSPADVLRRAWRRLRTMRTAIVLLLVLGAGASVGSFFPQRPVDTGAVRRWIDANESWAPIAELFGLFDVYGAWWFMAIYALLLVSLVGCLVPRYRALWRAVRARPFVTTSFAAQPRHAERTSAEPAGAVLERAHRLLRAKRYKIERHGDVVAAERGNWREGGSLLFHTSFLVLLLGMSVGKLFGFTGQVAVVEGERFVDTAIEYDFLEPGRWFGDRFSGLELALDSFDVSWYANGVPREFRSHVRVFSDGRQIREEDVVVNSPLTHEGLRIYQLSWGWAPEIRITQEGRVLYEGPTVFLSRDGLWRGVAKVPQTRPQQTGLEMLFFTDPEITPGGVPRDRRPEPVAPVLFFQQMVGDLNLDRAQSVYELDPRDLVPGEAGALRLGETARLPAGVELAFTGLRRYSVFQLAVNPGAGVLLLAAVALLVGLIPALYSARRRLWVRAVTDGALTRIEIAGHALQRKTAFEAEFATFVRDLVPGETVRTGVPSASG